MKVNSRKSYHLLFFILQPFLTLVHYLINFRKPYAKNVMWLFTIFFGATFAIGVESQGSDIVGYINDVEILNRTVSNFQEALNFFYLSGELDISRTLLALLVSFFTDDGHYLIIVFGIVFGYFYSRNMWYLLDRLEGRTKLFTRILLFCIFLTVPIWFLNGFRFWTATHMFLFGLLPYLFEGKKNSLIWCFITPFLMHFGFLIVILPLSLYLFLGNRLKPYFLFFLLTFFISSINITQFNSLITSYAPVSLAERTESYRNKEKVEEYRSEENSETRGVWYVRYYNKAITLVLTSLIVVIYFMHARQLIILNKNYLSLLSFIFLFCGFANILSSLPSGGRYLLLGNLLSIILISLIIQNFPKTKVLTLLSTLSTPFLVFFIIVAIRLSWYSISVMTIFGNPITAFFTFGENTALNDIIKGL